MKRHDIPPEGVAEQLNFSIPNLRCQVRLAPGDVPNESEPTPELMVVSTFRVCFEGFDAGSIHIVVTAADESQVRVLDVAADVGWLGTFYPGEPKGEHSLEASQETGEEPLTAAWRFRVIPANAPAGIVIPSTGPAGTTFAVALAGFDAGSEVAMLLYELDPATLKWMFRTVMEPARMDDGGEATYMLATEPDDPIGRYGVVTRPPHAPIPFTVTT